MDNDYEFILLRKFNVNLFKLPAKNIMGAKGHWLNSWKDNFWAGTARAKRREPAGQSQGREADGRVHQQRRERVREVLRGEEKEPVRGEDLRQRTRYSG